jgi:hypothetical protein
MNRNQCRFLGAVALLLPGCTGSLPVPPLRVDEPTRLAPPPPPPGMPGTAADAYEDDLYGAANRARVPFEDMAELVACLEAAHSVQRNGPLGPGPTSYRWRSA